MPQHPKRPSCDPSTTARSPSRVLHARVLAVLEDRDQPALCSRRLLARQFRRLGLYCGTDAVRRCAEDALLVASELVGNACRHTPGPTTFTAHWHPGTRRLTVSVTDPSPRVPVPTAADERGAHGGYGLCLIENLCENWTSVVRERRGKTVSATVVFPP